MTIQIKEGARIENPRGYELDAVESLRHFLEAGSPAQRDPLREGFYQIDGANEAYYIHISPVNGTVVLLAKWLRQSQEYCLSTENLVA